MGIILTDIRHCKKPDADERYAIVRSYKKPIPGVIQLPELSPSTNLFYKYLNMKKDGNWNIDSFKNIYVPWFLREMKQPQAINALNKIWNSAKTKDIVLACYCDKETLCHRSIVGALMKATDVPVTSNSALDISYYEQYCKI